VVDGVLVEGNVIPAFDDNKKHTVQVTLGVLAAAADEAAQ